MRSRNWDTVKCLIKHNSEKLIEKVKKAVQEGKQLDSGEGTQEHRNLISKQAQEVKAADIFKKNKAGQNAVACAAACREYDIMFNILQELKERGWGMNVLLEGDKDKALPIHTLIHLKAHNQVKRLLETVPLKLRQDMLEASNGNGNDALHMAAYRGYLSIFHLLLSNGAPLNGKGKSSKNYGNTVLDAAFRGWQCWTGIREKQSKMYEDIIKDLLGLMKDHPIPISGHAAKLYCAFERNSTKVCTLLLDWQSEKDRQQKFNDKEKRSKDDRKKTSKKDKKKGSKMDEKDESEQYGSGWTLSMVASQYGFKLPKPYSESNVDGQATLPPSAWSATDRDKRLGVEDGLVVLFKPREKISSKLASPSSAYYLNV